MPLQICLPRHVGSMLGLLKHCCLDAGTMWSCGALLPGSIQSRSREGMQQAMPVATISLNTRSACK